MSYHYDRYRTLLAMVYGSVDDDELRTVPRHTKLKDKERARPGILTGVTSFAVDSGVISG